MSYPGGRQPIVVEEGITPLLPDLVSSLEDHHRQLVPLPTLEGDPAAVARYLPITVDARDPLRSVRHPVPPS
jgi:hypothetical protein